MRRCDDDEKTYLKFIAAEVKKQSSSNNTSSNTTTAATTLLQIPQTAKEPTIPSTKGYLVQEIRDQLYWVTDGSYNTMLW
jgi:uncharacterized protein YdeI (BOF family)